MIETEGGNTVLLTDEEFSELARKMSPEDFQALVLDTLRRQSQRVIVAELAASKAVTELKRVDREIADHRTLITKLRQRVFPDEPLHSVTSESVN